MKEALVWETEEEMDLALAERVFVVVFDETCGCTWCWK